MVLNSSSTSGDGAACGVSPTRSDTSIKGRLTISIPPLFRLLPSGQSTPTLPVLQLRHGCRRSVDLPPDGVPIYHLAQSGGARSPCPKLAGTARLLSC